jgi:hypothetical protein
MPFEYQATARADMINFVSGLIKNNAKNADCAFPDSQPGCGLEWES